MTFASSIGRCKVRDNATDIKTLRGVASIDEHRTIDRDRRNINQPKWAFGGALKLAQDAITADQNEITVAVFVRDAMVVFTSVFVEGLLLAAMTNSRPISEIGRRNNHITSKSKLRR